MAPSADLTALQSRVAGRYSIERELGRGGMGVVYLAHDVALDRRVAIKLLPAEFAEQKTFRERFLREARLAARLSHPNIVPIHSVEEHDNTVFFVMGYIEGETLGQRIARVGALPPNDATTILQQMAWALAYAHGHGVVHRDVKPDNVLLETGTGRSYVMDFGIARAADPATGEHPGTSQLTEVGHVVGTAAFMSPEQATGDVIDGRADLYSLGVVGFVALTGRPPFSGASSQALLSKHLTEPAPPVASLRSGIPATVARTIDRLLQKDPAERFPTGEAVADALGSAATVQAEIAAPLRSYVRSGEQNVQYIGIAVGIVAIAIISPNIKLSVFFMILAIAGMRIFELVLMARRLYRMGYRFPDVEQSYAADKRAKDEERRQIASANDPVQSRRAIRRGAILLVGGVGTFVAGSAWVVSMQRDKSGTKSLIITVLIVGIAGLTLAMFGFMAIVQVLVANSKPKAQSKRSPFGSGPLSRWLFTVATRGLPPVPARDAAGALDQLFDEAEAAVPKPDRTVIRSVRDKLRARGQDVLRLRTRDRDLERAMAEAGEPQVTERLRAARAEVTGELERAAASIDAVRLKLILVKSGVASVSELQQLATTL